MRGRQPSETDEHVNRTDDLPLGQSGLGGTNDAVCEILGPARHARRDSRAPREPEAALYARLEQEYAWDFRERYRRKAQPRQTTRQAGLAATRRTLVTVEPISDTLIREAARRLGQAARKPARVILFGAFARGEPDAGSDVDFLVVQQNGFSRARRSVSRRP